jgi:hypothetical protein
MKAPFQLIQIVSVLALISGCSGGGGTATSAPITSNPVINPPGANMLAPGPDTSLQTSIKSSTYAAGSPEKIAFDRLNAERSQCGFGVLDQNASLDKAAKAHVEYIKATGLDGHFEDKALNPTLFTGVRPEERMAAAGYAGATAFTTTEEGGSSLYKEVPDTDASTRRLFAAPYHLLGLQDSTRFFGRTWFLGIQALRKTAAKY